MRRRLALNVRRITSRLHPTLALLARVSRYDVSRYARVRIEERKVPRWTLILSPKRMPRGLPTSYRRADFGRAVCPPQYTKDPVSGELRGAGPGPALLDIARALAARIGVEVELIGYQTPDEVMECLNAGACDVAFMGLERAGKVGLILANS